MAADYWWRSWHGAPTDLKWALIAKKAGAKTCEVTSLAWALMDFASQNEDRGSIDGFDVETFSMYSGIDEEVIQSIIAQMINKGVIEDSKFSKWDKRQPKSESEVSRVQEYRRRKKTEPEQSVTNPYEELHPVTDCYESLQDVTKNYTDTDTDTDTDNNCESKKPIRAKSSKPPQPKKSPSDPDYWKFLKENELLGKTFYQTTKLFPTGTKFGLWVKGFAELAEAGITPEVIPKAVARMREQGLTIKSPESILAIAREIMNNAGKSRDGTVWTRA